MPLFPSTSAWPWLVPCAAALIACGSGSTGGELVEFDVIAKGQATTTPTHEYRFTNDQGWRISLSEASLQIGAVYLNEQMPLPGGPFDSCTKSGLYVGEMTQALLVNALDPGAQRFPVKGQGLSIPAHSAELWLKDDRTALDAQGAAPSVHCHGTAQRHGHSIEFSARVSIGANRQLAQTEPNRPGANPVCRQRIVGPIAANFAPSSGGRLEITIDPAEWLRQTDFSTLPGYADGAFLEFPDDASTQASDSLFRGIKNTSASYHLEWSIP